MTGEPIVIFTGNLTEDPALRFMPSGEAVVNFTVACTRKYYDREAGRWNDSETVFLPCFQPRHAAENVSETLR